MKNGDHVVAPQCTQRLQVHVKGERKAYSHCEMSITDGMDRVRKPLVVTNSARWELLMGEQTLGYKFNEEKDIHIISKYFCVRYF